MYRDVGELHWVTSLMAALVEICEEEGHPEVSDPIVRAIEEIAPIVNVGDDLHSTMVGVPAGQNVIALDDFRRLRH